MKIEEIGIQMILSLRESRGMFLGAGMRARGLGR